MLKSISAVDFSVEYVGVRAYPVDYARYPLQSSLQYRFPFVARRCSLVSDRWVLFLSPTLGCRLLNCTHCRHTSGRPLKTCSAMAHASWLSWDTLGAFRVGRGRSGKLPEKEKEKEEEEVVPVGGGATCGAGGGEREPVMAEGGERTTKRVEDGAVVVPARGGGGGVVVAAPEPEPEAEPEPEPEPEQVQYTVDELLAQHQELVDSMLAEGYLDDQFSQLQMLQDESTPDFVEEVVTLFFDDSGKLLENLTDSLRADPIDYNVVDGYVHQFKGSSSSIGAQRVKQVCITFRLCCDKEDKQGCLNHLAKVKEEFNTVRTKLGSMLELEKKIVAGGGQLPVMEC